MFCKFPLKKKKKVLQMKSLRFSFTVLVLSPKGIFCEYVSGFSSVLFQYLQGSVSFMLICFFILNSFIIELSVTSVLWYSHFFSIFVSLLCFRFGEAPLSFYSNQQPLKTCLINRQICQILFLLFFSAISS